MNKKNNNDIEFILVEPSHSGNIGACARAIKNMGFKKLGIVKPRKTITKEAVSYTHLTLPTMLPV